MSRFTRGDLNSLKIVNGSNPICRKVSDVEFGDLVKLFPANLGRRGIPGL
ncbi:hypothetical protein THTE_3452 [Thermogutta terrifontis]|uniref:Uncharacterized protein n=1 Tax=Thermogutta terrifontis TaxID=1331910 RepID=A0A286RJC6_9BACT|nr:hypothetical protein THTE_3452 [Thermogutta terrifontis]